MTQPNYEELYQLKDPLANQPIRLDLYENDWLGPGEATQLLRGQLVPQMPLKFRPAMGGRFIDLLWGTYSSIQLISQKLVDLLTSYGITGWKTFKVEVKDKDGQIKPDYFGLAIIGKTGGHDLSRVQVVEKPPIVPDGPPYLNLKGMFFKNDYWDGSDFCLMGNTTTHIVTERVVKAFIHAKIRNVKFTRLPEVETPASVYEVQGLWPLNDQISSWG